MILIRSMHRNTLHHPNGFTLIEIIVAMGIMMLTLGLILANYNQGKSASLVSREAALMMGRIRLTQEQTSAGT